MKLKVYGRKASAKPLAAPESPEAPRRRKKNLVAAVKRAQDHLRSIGKSPQKVEFDEKFRIKKPRRY